MKAGAQKVYRRLRPVIALGLFAAAVVYALMGWNYTRSAWAFNAPPPASGILAAADRSFHDIGWMLLLACSVGALAAALAIWRRLPDRLRTGLLVVSLAAVAVGFAGDRAAAHVETHQPCACDDSVGMTPP